MDETTSVRPFIEAPPIGVSAQLPRWIGDRLVVPRGYGEVQSGLVRFFNKRRKMEQEERAAAAAAGTL